MLHRIIPAGIVIALTATAIAETHVVELAGLSFSPSELFVAQGDTIRFERVSGNHTATSGSDCTPDGVYFNAPVDAANPVFEWVVPGDAEGGIPFFCIPHCNFGMNGEIIVMPGDVPCAGDTNDDGEVNVVDLLAVLADWGPCIDCDDCSADFDDNCAVDVSDLLTTLAAWGPCPKVK